MTRRALHPHLRGKTLRSPPLQAAGKSGTGARPSCGPSQACVKFRKAERELRSKSGVTQEESNAVYRTKPSYYDEYIELQGCAGCEPGTLLPGLLA